MPKPQKETSAPNKERTADRVKSEIKKQIEDDLRSRILSTLPNSDVRCGKMQEKMTFLDLNKEGISIQTTEFFWPRQIQYLFTRNACYSMLLVSQSEMVAFDGTMSDLEDTIARRGKEMLEAEEKKGKT